MKDLKETSHPSIVYSCYHTKSREGENFVPEHVITYQISGSLDVHDGINTLEIEEGSIVLFKRNRLLKFIKHPPSNGDFRSISIFLDQYMLKDFRMVNDFKVAHKPIQTASIQIMPNPLFKVFFESLLAYSKNDSFQNQQYILIKQNEILLLLIQSNPELKDTLFDFTKPNKIDLEAFMSKNYHFNVKAERFAYLTGRSLASFKRDFNKIFFTSPQKWLKQKRLEEAHYLISKKGKTASAIYLDLGFENLSHFSYAFKKHFGVSPSKVLMHLNG
jgi:AraC-like DNA-binding protein